MWILILDKASKYNSQHIVVYITELGYKTKEFQVQYTYNHS